jgi:hypothetical protein
MDEKPISNLAHDVAGASGDRATATTVEDALSEAKNAVSTGKDEIVRQAKDAGAAVRDQAENLVDRGKEAGADEIDRYVGVARRAADDLEEHSPTGARYIREAAEGVEELTLSFREKSIGELIDGVQDFARRKPVIFFGGAMLTGFAILRFVKSSSERRTGQSAQSTVFSSSEKQARAFGTSPATSSSAGEAIPSSSSESQGGPPS